MPMMAKRTIMNFSGAKATMKPIILSRATPIIVVMEVRNAPASAFVTACSAIVPGPGQYYFAIASTMQASKEILLFQCPVRMWGYAS